MDRYRDLFLDESLKHLQAAEAALLAEGELGRDGVDGVFREIHSLKGMAASMGFPAMTDLAHRLEDRLHAWRSRSSSPDAEEVSLCLRVCDRLAEMRQDIVSGGNGDVEWHDLGTALSRGKKVPPAEAYPAGEGNLLKVRIDIDPECGSPSARAYLILMRFRELDPQVRCDPAQEEILRGGVLSRIDLVLHGVPREEAESVCETLTEVAGVSFPGAAPATPRRREEDRRPEGPLSGRPEDDLRIRLPETVQAPVRLLDEFVDLVGEMTISRSHLDDVARALDSAVLREEVDRLGTLIRGFHERVMGLRMLPFSLVTGGLRRVVRDLSGKLGKEVEVRVVGEELGMDKSILLQIADPLIHLLRNSVDHGIEGPQERQQAGKPRAGCVEVRAVRAKNQIEVTVADDGRGIDVEAVRCKAVEAGIFGDEESRRLGTREVFACLFRSGFSTRTEVSEVSGRGVGLDVVKSKVEGLGGSIEVVSSLGAGTEFRLSLPLSVAIVPVLTVAVGASVLALPVTSISSTLEALPRDVREQDGGHVLLTEDGEVPIVSLARVLRIKGKRKFERMPLVVIQGQGQGPSGVTALAVDRFLREEDLFIKPLKGPLRRLPGLSGYSVLGDGSLVFLLDPATLIGG